MTAPSTIPHLAAGTTYRATTHLGVTVGEYLGMETPYGVRAILLRHGGGTDSIPLACVTSIRAAA